VSGGLIPVPGRPWSPPREPGPPSAPPARPSDRRPRGDRPLDRRCQRAPGHARCRSRTHGARA